MRLRDIRYPHHSWGRAVDYVSRNTPRSEGVECPNCVGGTLAVRVNRSTRVQFLVCAKGCGFTCPLHGAKRIPPKSQPAPTPVPVGPIVDGVRVKVVNPNHSCCGFQGVALGTSAYPRPVIAVKMLGGPRKGETVPFWREEIEPKETPGTPPLQEEG